MYKVLFLLMWIVFASPLLAGFTEGEAAFSARRYAEAMQALRPLADQGDYRAQYYVAYMYLNGYGVTKNSDYGVSYLQKSVDQNYNLAQALMGFLYEQGEDVPRDYAKALELYQKAAEQGNTSALLNLAVMYYFGHGVPENLVKAIELLEQIPIEEQPAAGRYLGDVYLARDSSKTAEAMRAYQEAAQAGDLLSYIALAKFYLDGQGVDVDARRALRYYEYAAAQGNAQAQYELGLLYVNGRGVTKNTALGHAWLSYAASQNYEPAAMALNQLKGEMTLADQEKSRQEFIRIQEKVLGQVESPLAEDMIKTQVKQAQDNEQSQSFGRRRRRRRRR